MILKRLAANWRGKNVLINICPIIFLCCIISCVPSNDRQINAQTHLQLALAYLQLNQYDLAEKQLQQAILYKKNYFDAQLTLAYLYQIIGKPEKARSFYDKIIHQHPFSSKIYNNYGIFLCQQKQYSKANFAFNTALKYDPENKAIKNNLKLLKAIKT